MPAQIKIHAQEDNSYVFPDATIFCEQMQFHDEKRSIVMNPSVVFEVISKSSEEYDLGPKFFIYQSTPSIKEYILVDSRRRWAKACRKEGDDLWSFESFTKRDSELYIRTIDLHIPFDELYRNVLLKFSV